jgi:hypothetical protein
MSEEKFTQGEWKAETRTLSFNDVFRFGFQVITKEKRVCFCETDDAKNIDEMSVNACLISAAPSMYRELNRQCILCKLSDHETECELCSIGGILKKARGEE